MKVNVPHVATLANLPLKDEEITQLESQLSEILDYVKKLDEVDTKNVEPTSQVTGLENILREDKARDSLSQKYVLQNAKSQKNGMLQVKGIFDNE